MPKPKPKYCDECAFVEFVKVEETGEFATLCSKSRTRCTEERSGLFKDACGPTGKNFKKG